MGRSTDDQVAAMRREMQQLALRLDSMRARDSTLGHSAQCRIARIENTPANGDNTFNIVFLDGSYPQAAGQQSPSWMPRQYTARTVAYNLTGSKLNQGTVVHAFYWSRHWWVDRVVSSADSPESVPREARWTSPVFRAYNAIGNEVERYLWEGATESVGVTFTNQVNDGVPITHDNNDTDFTDDGNFTVNQNGSYEIITQAIVRLARDTSGASSPPSSPSFTGFHAEAYISGSPVNASLSRMVITAHNESHGWGVSDTVYFSWQPDYRQTYSAYRNMYVGNRFKVRLSLDGPYPPGYGLLLQGLGLYVRYLGPPQIATVLP